MNKLLHSQLTASLAATDADDLWQDIRCAILDSYDGEPLTIGALQAQFENYGLVVSRKPPPVRCSSAETYTIETWKRTP